MYWKKSPQGIYRDSDWNLCWQSGNCQGIFFCQPVATLKVVLIMWSVHCWPFCSVSSLSLQYYGSRPAKAHPEPSHAANTTGSPSPAESPPDHVTMFHKPSRTLLNLPNNSPEEQVTLFFKPTKEVVNLRLPQSGSAEGRVTPDPQSEVDPKLKSIDELMWKPSKVELRKLPNYYMNLSKIRLSGEWVKGVCWIRIVVSWRLGEIDGQGTVDISFGWHKTAVFPL